MLCEVREEALKWRKLQRRQTLKLGFDRCVTDPQVEEVGKGTQAVRTAPAKSQRSDAKTLWENASSSSQDIKWEGAGQGKTGLLDLSMTSSTDPVLW